MLSPLPRRSVWAYCFAHFAQPCQPSPIWRSGRPAHRPFRGLLGVHSRYGLHTRAVTVYRDPPIRRLQPLRFLHSCSGCFRLERLPGGACTHWKAPPFHGARQLQTRAVQQPVPLFDYFVGAAAQRQRHGDAEHLGSLEVDVQLDFRCLLDRQFGRLLALEDTAGIDTS